MTMPPGAEPLGSKLYVFKSKTNVKDVLISAHGGYYRANNTFDVPTGVSMKFYGEHDKTLSDPGMSLMYLNAEVTEEIPAGKPCINYILSKYQGRHNQAGETYGSINSFIDAEDQRIFKTMLSWSAEQNASRKNIQAHQLASYKSMSVVTIRNRAMRSDVNLSYVVETVKKAMPGAVNFHCSFCRSNINDANPDSSRVQLIA